MFNAQRLLGLSALTGALSWLITETQKVVFYPYGKVINMVNCTYYLRQGGIKFATICLSFLPSIHPFVSRITLILLVPLYI